GVLHKNRSQIQQARPSTINSIDCSETAKERSGCFIHSRSKRPLTCNEKISLSAVLNGSQEIGME
ncbi:hypothetical protein Q6294_33005, partial [Klebsiella pneumoniae]